MRQIRPNMDDLYFALYYNGRVFVEVPKRFTEDFEENTQVADLVERVQYFFDDKGLGAYFTAYALSAKKVDFAYEPRIAVDSDGWVLYIPGVFTLTDINYDYLPESTLKLGGHGMPNAIITGSLNKILKWAKPLIASDVEKPRRISFQLMRIPGWPIH